MSMSLLKAKKHYTLNKLGSHLLQKIAQKKPIYISGIVKHLAELIFADQEAVQYSGNIKIRILENAQLICIILPRMPNSYM